MEDPFCSSIRYFDLLTALKILITLYFVQPSPTTFDEVFQNVFDYIDRLFNMVRPRKLLYMAIGGDIYFLVTITFCEHIFWI